MKTKGRNVGRPAVETVGRLQPVNAPVVPSDEAVEARRHVDRDSAVNVRHYLAPRCSASESSIARALSEIAFMITVVSGIR